MERKVFFDDIESRLSLLVTRIELRSGCNLLDLNIHSEDFYVNFFNLLFNWKLKNLNTTTQNAAAIDLIDDTNKILVQVSATATKQKIESALAKDLSKYNQFHFKFISISKDASDLRKKTYDNPHNVVFIPSDDIYDVKKLLTIIKSLNIDLFKSIHEFILKEIAFPIRAENIELNISNLISLLAQEDWGANWNTVFPKPFDIDKKIEFNKLKSSREIIEGYKNYHHRIDEIYTEFDKQGRNKSFSVLSSLRTIYIKNSSIKDADECFRKVIGDVADHIKVSSNYNPIPEEELIMCVELIVVDAFLRCKIFKNPEGYLSVITR